MFNNSSICVDSKYPFCHSKKEAKQIVLALPKNEYSAAAERIRATPLESLTGITCVAKTK